MREELYNKAGFYSTSFLKMHVHSSESLVDIRKVSKETEATYLHEYIHFLQDITTSYGLMNISTVVDYIRLVTNKVKNDGKSEFEVPFDPSSSLDNNVKANWEFKKIYLGDGEKINDIKKLIKVHKEPKFVKTNVGDKSFESLIVEFEDSYNKKYKYSIGAYCICESMAYTIEQYIYPKVLPPADRMPYESVKIVCDNLYPGFSSDPLNIVALCDACLMYFNPGPILHDSLIEMKKQLFAPNKPEEIYNFVYHNTKFSFNGHTTINQLLISMGAEAVYQLSGYFTTDLFKQNRHWVNYIITTGIHTRMELPFFILDFTRKGEITENPLFISALYKIGSPLVVNDSGEFTHFPPNDFKLDMVPEYFWVINQIYKILKGELSSVGYRCEMLDWCNQSCDNAGVNRYTDDRCKYAPWERASDDDLKNHCPFGKMWKTWGMKDKIPVIK